MRNEQERGKLKAPGGLLLFVELRINERAKLNEILQHNGNSRGERWNRIKIDTIFELATSL